MSARGRAGGVVLAGGRSTRMRTPKAQLDWHGRPLVRHVAATLADALAGGPVVVVRAPGQALPPLPDGVAIAEDAEERRGPLQGLVAGLCAMRDRADVAVVVATDQPFAAPLAAGLLGCLRAGDDAVAVRIGDGLQPLGAVYRTTVAAEAQARLDGGDGSLRGLLEAIATRVVEGGPAEAAALRSLDTPEAYAEALRP